MSSSSESDELGYLAAPSDTDGSFDSEELDQGRSRSGESGDEADGSSDEAAKSSNYFDLEAVDSDDETSASEQSRIGDHNFFFPLFKSLPFELRYRIWQFFCPEITVPSRVYWFQADTRFRRDGSLKMVAAEGPFLEQQTRSVRSLLAIHRETRELALRALPDTLSVGRRGTIRFNSAKDVVIFDSLEDVIDEFELMPRLRGFSEHIRHLAVDPLVIDRRGIPLSVFFASFKNLKTIYYLTDPDDHPLPHLRWCTADKVNRYSITTFEEGPGLGEDGQHLHCWPDTTNHPDFAEAEVPLDEMASDLLHTGSPVAIKGAEFNGIPIWPMVVFWWESPWGRFHDVLEWERAETPEGESEGSSDNDEGPSGYESEGIDDTLGEDAQILSDEELDEDDQILGDEESEVLQNGSSDQDGSVMGHGTAETTDGEDEDVARFSSPEQSPVTLQQSEEESAQETDLAGPRARRLKHPRARVVDSSSEDEGSREAIPQKRARTYGGIQRRSLVLSSSDEKDARPSKRRSRRTRAVMSSDEDDQNDDDEQDGSDLGQSPNRKNDSR
ncbi:hypothetical protein VTH06DRAFT_6315 [Thermothelomyces fergusii]